MVLDARVMQGSSPWPPTSSCPRLCAWATSTPSSRISAPSESAQGFSQALRMQSGDLGVAGCRNPDAHACQLVSCVCSICCSCHARLPGCMHAGRWLSSTRGVWTKDHPQKLSLCDWHNLVFSAPAQLRGNVCRQVAEQYEGVWTKDRTHNLVVRLRHNVIRAGLYRISLAYWRISLADVAAKLGTGCGNSPDRLLDQLAAGDPC